MRNPLFAIGAACLAVVTFSGPAQAQVNGWLGQRPAYSDDYDYRQSYYDSRRIAYDNGYREGLRDGESAARHQRPFDIEREKDWRKADAGYNRSYGSKDRYRDNFRSGYSDGYRAAYDRFYSNGGYYDPRSSRRDGGWNGYPGRYPQDGRVYRDGRYGDYGTGVAHIAFQNGINDGYEKGLDDARDRKYPDPMRQKWYRQGDRHYEGRYGSREAYKDQYRRGFVEGYQRAYRDARHW